MKPNIFLISLAFFLFLLWDIYHLKYGKVFDIAGIIVVFFIFILNLKNKLKLKINKCNLLIFMVPFIIIGLLFENLQDSIVILLGFATVTIFSTLQDKPVKVKILEAAIYFLIITQIIQFVYFYTFGVNLIFYPTSIFAEPRNFDGSNFFRASGIMAEANALVTTLMLLILGILNAEGHIKKTLFFPIIFSLIISKSFFGWLLIPFIMYAANCFSLSQILSVSISSIFIFIYYIDMSIFIYRIENFTDDPSFQARLGLNSISSSFVNLLIPEGFSSSSTSKIAANGFMYLLNGMGIFAFVFIFFMYKLLNCHRAFLVFILTLMSYQVFTMQLFWAVIGLTSSRKVNDYK